MNARPFRFIALIVAICFFGGEWNALAGLETTSPNLLAAMKSLQAAKTDTDPLPDLNDALKSLQKAINNRGGKRDAAIALVNDAVKLSKDGDTDGMNQKIDAAIAEVHSGMSRGGHTSN
jgi:hypothetical protein